jgi:hypothetical protein
MSSYHHYSLHCRNNIIPAIRTWWVWAGRSNYLTWTKLQNKSICHPFFFLPNTRKTGRHEMNRIRARKQKLQDRCSIQLHNITKYHCLPPQFSVPPAIFSLMSITFGFTSDLKVQKRIVYSKVFVCQNMKVYLDLIIYIKCLCMCWGVVWSSESTPKNEVLKTCFSSLNPINDGALSTVSFQIVIFIFYTIPFPHLCPHFDFFCVRIQSICLFPVQFCRHWESILNILE